MQRIELCAGEEAQGRRLDQYIAEECRISRSLAQQLIADGHVLLGGGNPPKSAKLEVGDRLAVEIPPPRDIRAVPQDIPLAVVFEDKHLLVVDKPKGMVVHPAGGNWENTLVNALLFHCKGALSGIRGEIRPGIVHRIDKDTSGLLVVAKDDETHQGLASQFAAHSVRRVYQAVVHGHMPGQAGRVEGAIGRDKKNRKKMAVVATGGKSAATNYRVIAEYSGFAQLALELETGRTHQIRVHMAHIGHPVAGDILYGPKKAAGQLHGQCLHAGVLGFAHPATGEVLLFESPLPAYFTAFLQKLE